MNPPSCFPVTFDPVKRTFEFSGVTARLSPFAAGCAAAAVFETGVEAFDVTARVLLAAGSSHAARNIEIDRITKPNLFTDFWSSKEILF